MAKDNNTLIKRRKDQWMEADDSCLIQTIIQGVRDGKSQLKCFEEAAIELGRTKQACGFRWNKVLREDHAEVLAEAKIAGKGTIRVKYDTLATKYEELKQDYDALKKKYEDLLKSKNS